MLVGPPITSSKRVLLIEILPKTCPCDREKTFVHIWYQSLVHVEAQYHNTFDDSSPQFGDDASFCGRDTVINLSRRELSNSLLPKFWLRGHTRQRVHSHHVS